MEVLFLRGLRNALPIAIALWIIILLLVKQAAGEPTPAPVMSAAATGSIVTIQWRHAAIPANYIYILHFEEKRDLTHCYYDSRKTTEIQVDGSLYKIISNWCAAFGSLKMGIKVKAYRKTDHAVSPWSSEITYQRRCQ
jgi:hypothetical protein